MKTRRIKDAPQLVTKAKTAMAVTKRKPGPEATAPGAGKLSDAAIEGTSSLSARSRSGARTEPPSGGEHLDAAVQPPSLPASRSRSRTRGEPLSGGEHLDATAVVQRPSVSTRSRSRGNGTLSSEVTASTTASATVGSLANKRSRNREVKAKENNQHIVQTNTSGNQKAYCMTTSSQRDDCTSKSDGITHHCSSENDTATATQASGSKQKSKLKRLIKTPISQLTALPTRKTRGKSSKNVVSQVPKSKSKNSIKETASSEGINENRDSSGTEDHLPLPSNNDRNTSKSALSHAPENQSTSKLQDIRMESPEQDNLRNSLQSISSSTPKSASLSFSNISYSESPIIRTRKPNSKYADCVMPAKFTFMKQAILNSARTPNVSEPTANYKMKSATTSPQSSEAILFPSIVDKEISPKIRLTRKSSRKQLKDCIASSMPVTPVVQATPKATVVAPSTSTNKTVSRKQPKSKISQPEIKTRVLKSRNKSPKIIHKNLTVAATKKTAVPKRNTTTARKNNKKTPAVASSATSPNNTNLITTQQKNDQKSNNKSSERTKSTTSGSKRKTSLINNIRLSIASKSDNSTVYSPDFSDEELPTPATNVNLSYKTPVKLSECPIKLAVFKSPPQKINKANSVVVPVAHSSVLSANSLASNINQSLNTSLVSNYSTNQQPRLSKREQLALALRRGQLNNTMQASKINSSSSTFVTPAIAIKPVKKMTKKGNAATAKNSASQSESTVNQSSVPQNTLSRKLPVWASTSPLTNKSVHRPAKAQKRLSRRSLEVFDLSFSNEEDIDKKTERKKKTKTKAVKLDPKPRINKFGLLTTDPGFNKEFPTMFGVKTFYNHSESRVARSIAATETSHEARPLASSTTAHEDDDDTHFDMDMHDNFDDRAADDPEAAHHHEHGQEGSTSGSYYPPQENETASSFVPNSSSNMALPDIIVTAAATAQQLSGGVATSAPAVDNTGSQLSSANNNNNNNSKGSNKSLPTPAANRILSKLVGGTSTPFNDQMRSTAFPDSGNQMSSDTQQPSLPAPPPAPVTVTEQIQVCFGFEDSEEEEDEENTEGHSLNLSPVRGSINIAPHHQHNYHQLSRVSMFSDTGLGEKSVAPTRFVPVSRGGYGGSFSASHSNSTIGLSRTSRVGRPTVNGHASVNEARMASSVIQKSHHSRMNVPAASKARAPTTANGSITTTTQPEDTAANTGTHDTLNNGNVNSTVPTAVSTVTTSVPPLDFNESRLFDEELILEGSPVKVAQSSAHQQEEEPQQHCALAVSEEAHVNPSPEKSFTQPPRKLYDRRSLEQSRKSLLESIAGGAPDSEDDHDNNLADQEDMSHASVAPLRRKKKRTAAVTAAGKATAKSNRGVAAKRTLVRTATSGSTTTTTATGSSYPDTSQDEDVSDLPPVKRLKQAKKQPTSASGAAADGAKVVRRTKQTKLKLVKLKARPTVPVGGTSTAAAGTLNGSENSNASSSGILSITSKQKRPTKAAVLEQTVNDWASDVNCHFSEIEDCELVLA